MEDSGNTYITTAPHTPYPSGKVAPNSPGAPYYEPRCELPGHAAFDALLAAAEAVDAFHGDSHMTTCATQPTWASGRDSQGLCDCCYGQLRAAIKLAKGDA